MTPAVKALERAGVAHRVLGYHADPATASYGLAAAEALGLNPEQVYKTLIAELDGGRLCVAMVPVDRSLRLKSLAAAAAARGAVMADPAKATAATGYVVGGISPLGQRRHLPAFLHADAARHALLYVSAGRRGLELELATADLIRCTQAELVDIAGQA